MADELKPNPFCGHAVMRDYVANDQWNDITGTEPDTCGMCEEIFRMSDEDWNRRPIEDALRAEVEMRGDQVSALMEQVARYMAEAQDLRDEITALKAMYAGPLTDEQAISAMPAIGFHLTPSTIKLIDAAIRAARERGRGDG